MNQKNNTNPALIFPCSGASDVGELADRTARRLSRSGFGKMFCLAAIGGRVQQYIDDTQSAKKIIIIESNMEIDICKNSGFLKILKMIE